MDYITISEASDKWGVSIRRVYQFLEQNRIEGAVRFGTAWMIPASAEKPDDPRREKKNKKCKLLIDLNKILDETLSPMPIDEPDRILDTIRDESLRIQYEGELAYLRGDFKLIKNYYHKTEGDDASRLRISSVAIAAAISTGDYSFYSDIEGFLKGIIEANKDNSLSVFAELCLSTAYTGAAVANMVPDWLKDGDFLRLNHKVWPDAAYKRTKYFQYLGKYESMLNVAQTALLLFDPTKKIVFQDIYLRVVCAMACNALEQRDKAKTWLKDVMDTALPHGFITPFAESASAFGGLLEQILEQDYPDYYESILNQWKATFANWLSFHNQFTKNNITLILSLREYQMALLVARRTPYAKIAEQFSISVGRLNNIMREVYAKLYVSNREELAKVIL